MVKQVHFVDLENDCTHAGILLDSGDVICGCCGGLFEADDRGEQWDVLNVLDDWQDLTVAILEGEYPEVNK